jgi:gluconokinase
LIGEEIAAATDQGEGVVAACSALKRMYRDRLRLSCPELAFIYLKVEPTIARLRVGSRKGHFMPASLVDSQLADLDPPHPDETALVLDAARTVEDLVEDAVRYVSAVFVS